jgi:hypothetical protein
LDFGANSLPSPASANALTAYACAIAKEAAIDNILTGVKRMRLLNKYKFEDTNVQDLLQHTGSKEVEKYQAHQLDRLNSIYILFQAVFFLIVFR